MKDARGTEIEVGQTVAFNFSGEIAVGVIERIAPSKRYGHEDTVFHVRRITHTGHWAKPVSRVTRPQNLLVLFENNA